MSSHCFSKSYRLLNASDYQAVFDHAPFRASHPNLLILARPSASPHSRLGLVIAKKHIRHAAQRNRIKRHVREFFRLHQQQLGNIDAVFLARKGLDELDNPALRKLLQKQWQRVSKKALAKQPSAPHNAGNKNSESRS